MGLECISEDTSSDYEWSSITLAKKDELTSFQASKDTETDANSSLSYRISSSQQTEDISENDLSRNQDNLVECDFPDCCFVSENHDALTVHKKDEHPLSSPNTKRKPDPKLHLCTELGCKAAFTRPYRLKDHINAHHKRRKIKCSECHRSYTSYSHLKRHQVVVHEGQDIKDQVCQYDGCGKIFANKYSLKKHVIRKHISPRFSCNLCSEKFDRKTFLSAHKVTAHSEEPPYQCDKCPKNFIQLHLYRKHLSRHKTFKCDCNETFEHWSKYLNHRKNYCKMSKSKQHKCVVCNKLFSTKENLTQHSLKVHVPESELEVFKCAYLDCNRSYKYKKNLTFHIKSFHENRFEYVECTHDGCQAVLKSKKNLKQHLKLCHQDKLRVEKKRKARKDKGKPKKSFAAKLSGVKDIKQVNNELSV